MPPARILFDITGSFRKENGVPDAGHPYYFARAAELAWSNHAALAAMDRQLQQNGFAVQFRLNGTQSLRVGPGFTWNSTSATSRTSRDAG